MPKKITEEGVEQAVTTDVPDFTAKRKRKTKKGARIGTEEVREALEILQRYKSGKANLERKVVDNEQFWKLQHWSFMRSKSEQKQLEPTSAWLFNAIANKHADAMDNFPMVNVLPREESDTLTAKTLEDVIPAIFEQNHFEQTYSDTWWYKLKTGTGVYGVFWDNALGNGLGDISIRKVDLLNLFWEPGITDIQKSRNFFHVELRDNDLLEDEYPELKLDSSPSVQLAEYIYDDSIDTSDKSAVVDWYYKKNIEEEDADGNKYTRTVLHYCKFVNDTVLYASENEEDYKSRGFYDHGLYPFVFDVLYPMEGTPAGFGYVDIMQSPQAYIDKLDQAIIENALVSSRKRFFVRSDGSIDEEEMADLTKPFVHTDSSLGEDSIREINYHPLSNIYYNIKLGKIDELKETSGNRDFSQGSVANGVTAASAITALMEAGSKLSRDMLKSSYRADTNITYLVIELIRQFYDEPRVFRITGDINYSFLTFDNRTMRPQQMDFGSRLPIFDIKVVPEKQSTFSRMSQNELALQLYGQGFFTPENATPALACLEMMNFEGKNAVIQKVAEGQTLMAQIQQLQQQLMQLSAIVDAQNGTSLTQNMGAAIQGQEPERNGTPKAVNLDTNKTLAQKSKEMAASQASPR